MNQRETYSLRPIGWVRSQLVSREDAPMQGYEGAPDAWVEVDVTFAEALKGIEVGEDLILITWLHAAHRDILQVHPRSDETRPLTGVFATRSPDRPNPLGLHRVRVRQIEGNRLKVGPLEANRRHPGGRYQARARGFGGCIGNRSTTDNGWGSNRL